MSISRCWLVKVLVLIGVLTLEPDVEPNTVSFKQSLAICSAYCAAACTLGAVD